MHTTAPSPPTQVNATSMFNEVDEDGDDCVTRAQWLAKGLARGLLWRAAAALPTALPPPVPPRACTTPMAISCSACLLLVSVLALRGEVREGTLRVAVGREAALRLRFLWVFRAHRWQEFIAFWKNVVGSGYAQDDILEEVEMMLEGGSWVDFDDGRTT